MKTILAPPSSKLLMPTVNSIITNLKHARMIEEQKDPSFFKCKIPVLVKEHYILIAEKCMSRIFEDQKKVSIYSFELIHLYILIILNL